MVIQSADIAWGGYEGHGMHKVLTDDGCEHRDPFNYFVGENLPEHKTIFDFGCMVRFVGVKIRNAMNVGHSNS